MFSPSGPVELVFLVDLRAAEVCAIVIFMGVVGSDSIFLWITSKSVPASTRLEDPSRKGTTRTAKSAPYNPCPSREGPHSTVSGSSCLTSLLSHMTAILSVSGSSCLTSLLSHMTAILSVSGSSCLTSVLSYMTAILSVSGSFTCNVGAVLHDGHFIGVWFFMSNLVAVSHDGYFVGVCFVHV